MLTFNGNLKVHVALEPCDMRKSFNTLADRLQPLYQLIATRILLLIGSIYRLEKRMDERNAHPLDRQRARWLESRKPYDHLRKLVGKLIRFRGLTPRDGLHKALTYAIERIRSPTSSGSSRS